MAHATALTRRLAFTWLALCVAGFGGPALAAPGLVEWDAESAAELCVTRDTAGAYGSLRSRNRGDRRAGGSAFGPRRLGGHSKTANLRREAATTCRFPSPRMTESRIQV